MYQPSSVIQFHISEHSKNTIHPKATRCISPYKLADCHYAHHEHQFHLHGYHHLVICPPHHQGQQVLLLVDAPLQPTRGNPPTLQTLSPL